MDDTIRRRAPLPPAIRDLNNSNAQLGDRSAGLQWSLESQEALCAVVEEKLSHKSTLLGMELIINLFFSAINSSRPLVICTPFPVHLALRYLDDQGITKTDTGDLLRTARDWVAMIPSLDSPSVAELLHGLPRWTNAYLAWLASNGKVPSGADTAGAGSGAKLGPPSLRAVPAGAVPEKLVRMLSSEKNKPSLVFEVVNEEGGVPVDFCLGAERYGTDTAFHGSSVENWYSIITSGLQILSGTSMERSGQLYGEGVYLCTEVGVCKSFAPRGICRRNSFLGHAISVVGVVEVVRHPSVRAGLTSGEAIPAYGEHGDKVPPHGCYLVCSNPTLLRVTHLLVYAEKAKPMSGFLEHFPMLTKIGGVGLIVLAYLLFLLLLSLKK